MATKFDWSSPIPKAPNKSGGGGPRPVINKIKFEAGSTHIVRPIGKCVTFYRFFGAGRYWYADKEQLQEMQDLLKAEPQLRFAINVIDRADDVVKILEGPITMLEDFAEVAQSTKQAPGSAGGGDWKITSTGEKKARRYKVNFLGPQPFTEQETLRVKNPDPAKNEFYILEQVYKANDPKQVKERIEKFGDASGDEAPKYKPKQPVPSVSDDEEFGPAGSNDQEF